MRLLLVEDDLRLVHTLRPALQRAHFVVDHCDNGVEGQFMGEEIDYDAVILDLGLPQRSGLAVLAAWRQQQRRLPVLILTARDSWQERVDGLRAGADDYLGKPFHTEELLARLEALCRRAHGRAAAELRVGGLRLLDDQQQVELADGTIQKLTATEFRLLRYLMLNPHKLLSKSSLMEHIYDDASEPESNIVEAYIKRLRQKIGHDAITTQRGQGYQLNGA